MSVSVHIAVDLGAESGRVVVGVLEGDRVECVEVHRFGHAPVAGADGLCWDLAGIWREMMAGLGKAGAWCRERGHAAATVGVDTWGVDFGLIGEGGELLDVPRCYRDPRNEAAYREVIAAVGEDAIYGATGIQFMPLNTLYQLAAMKKSSPELLKRARALLFMPDLLHYLLSGAMKVERSIASTSQMYDPVKGTWAWDLIARCGLPAEILLEPVDAGAVVGGLRREIAEETGLGSGVRVVTPAAHDTASAVAAVPAEPGTRWAYLSSGTWSLMGVELAGPNLSDAARRAPFTNEVGVGRSVRFLKNIAGLWLVQEIRRELAARGEAVEYAELVKRAEGAEAWRTVIDPDWAPLASPGRMLEKIAVFARATGQPEPRDAAGAVRCCLESLALAYDGVRGRIGAVTGVSPEVLHVVGGGGRNEFLNRLTAATTGVRVVVGPYEATALGNVLVQAMGVGRIGGPQEVRRIARASDAVREIAGETENQVVRDAIAGAKSRYSAVVQASPRVLWSDERA